MERLQSLQGLDIKISNLSYEQVEIPPRAVVYCDIPYRGTNRYKTEFDYDKFYEWAVRQDVPLFISEYAMPEKDFVCIWQKDKVCTLSSTNNTKTVERLFVNKKYYDSTQGMVFAV